MDLEGAVRRWWPVPAFVAAAILVQLVVMHGRSASGHAAGHLGSASAIFPMAVLLAVIIWAAPSAWRRPELWVAGAAYAAGGVMVTIGNLRVVNSIGADNWTDAQAAALGPARPGFESGHDLAEQAMWLVVAGAVVLAVLLMARGHVSRRAGIGAVLLSVLFPPWILPGAGVLVLAVALCLSYRRSSTTGLLPKAPSAGPSPEWTPPMHGS